MQAEGSEAGITRRGLLIGAAGVGVVVAAGGVGYAAVPSRWKQRLGIGGEDWFIPNAPKGQFHLETVHSDARGTDVELFTAVPDGYGDGAGLPVVIVLHGGTGRPHDYEGFGFPQFVTQSVSDGNEPFVLAGADSGVLGWQPSGSDDPQAMVVEEMPQWLADRGYDADRRVLWGWSLGGRGSLLLAEAYPDYARSVAAFSPALQDGDKAFDGVEALADVPLAIWCGTEDMFYDNDRAFVAALSPKPEIVTYAPGAHTRYFWNNHTLEAFKFCAEHLST
ncbi:MAG TPA: alpha/beta hydrolase-fold protein [Nocardioidaceae bacterium]|nr:alpha/beta hydrolase-fold protein [Nocardioidaceae bacterium]